MYKFLTKNGQTLAFGLGVLITILFMANILPNMEEFSLMPEEQQDQTSIFNIGLMGAIVLTVLAAVAMVAFGLFQVATDFKGSIKGLLGFAVLIGIFLIAYTTSSGEPTPYIQGAVDKFAEGGNELTAGNLKFIGGGIRTSVILVAIAALAFVLAEIRNFFN